MQACRIVIALGILAISNNCAPKAVTAIITVEQAARVDMRAFTGIYVAGFVLESDQDDATTAQANEDLVRGLNQQLARRGYTVLWSEPAWYRAGRRFPFDNFAGQTRLVITGHLRLAELSQKGFKTRTREVFDPMGRRQVEERRMYIEEQGWLLTGSLVLLARHRPFLRLSGLRAEIRENVRFNPPSLAEALVTFCIQDLTPAVLSAIEPQQRRVQRVLIQ